MEENKFSGLICPECSHSIEIMCVIGADESLVHKEERLCLCHNCLSTWDVVGDIEHGDFQIQRYFFG